MPNAVSTTGKMFGSASRKRIRRRPKPLLTAVDDEGPAIASSSDTRATRLSSAPGTTPMAMHGNIHDEGPRKPNVGRTFSSTPKT